MEILNVTLLLIYEAKIHVSLDSVTNVTRFSDQPLMLEKYIFSSPEHKVLKVSYCDHPVSGVRRQSSVVHRVSSTIHSKYISS